MNQEASVEKKAGVKNGIRRLILAGIAVILELLLTAMVFNTWLKDYAGILSILYHIAAKSTERNGVTP